MNKTTFGFSVHNLNAYIYSNNAYLPLTYNIIFWI